MSDILGKGAYGDVFKHNNSAVKCHKRLRFLLQEYVALRYTADCQHIVHTLGWDIYNLKLTMDLYDCSLKKWMSTELHSKFSSNTLFSNIFNPSSEDYINNNVMIIIRDVLLGLVELHDRKLTHGDLKPGNILIKNNPLKAVLGDCGFLSHSKYSKVTCTAIMYKDPISDACPSHDMYSFGMCFLELLLYNSVNLAKIIPFDGTPHEIYSKIQDIISSSVTNPKFKSLLLRLLHHDKDKRPTSRETLNYLFNISPPVWTQDFFNYKEHRYNIPIIRETIKLVSYYFDIKRSKKGYGALLYFIQEYNIHPKKYLLYTYAVLIILAYIFSESALSIRHCLYILGDNYTISSISDIPDKLPDPLPIELSDIQYELYSIINTMVDDNTFIKILLSPV